MTNADIYYCQKDREIGVVSSFASGNERPQDYTDATGIILESVGTSVFSDGGYSCSFKRPVSVTKESQTINLDNEEKFYVLIARGGGDQDAVF